MSNWLSIVLAASIPLATFIAAYVSQKKTLRNEYVVSVEGRVSRLETQVATLTRDLTLCSEARQKLTEENRELKVRVSR